MYNVTFTAPEHEDSLDKFDANLALLAIEESDDFNDSYVDDLISDYYFPIIDLTTNDDEPKTTKKRKWSIHTVVKKRTKTVKPASIWFNTSVVEHMPSKTHLNAAPDYKQFVLTEQIQEEKTMTKNENITFHL